MMGRMLETQPLLDPQIPGAVVCWLLLDRELGIGGGEELIGSLKAFYTPGNLQRITQSI